MTKIQRCVECGSRLVKFLNENTKICPDCRLVHELKEDEYLKVELWRVNKIFLKGLHLEFNPSSRDAFKENRIYS